MKTKIRKNKALLLVSTCAAVIGIGVWLNSGGDNVQAQTSGCGVCVEGQRYSRVTTSSGTQYCPDANGIYLGFLGPGGTCGYLDTSINPLPGSTAPSSPSSSPSPSSSSSTSPTLTTTPGVCVPVVGSSAGGTGGNVTDLTSSGKIGSASSPRTLAKGQSAIYSFTLSSSCSQIRFAEYYQEATPGLTMVVKKGIIPSFPADLAQINKIIAENRYSNNQFCGNPPGLACSNPCFDGTQNCVNNLHPDANSWYMPERPSGLVDPHNTIIINNATAGTYYVGLYYSDRNNTGVNPANYILQVYTSGCGTSSSSNIGQTAQQIPAGGCVVGSLLTTGPGGQPMTAIADCNCQYVTLSSTVRYSQSEACSMATSKGVCLTGSTLCSSSSSSGSSSSVSSSTCANCSCCLAAGGYSSCAQACQALGYGTTGSCYYPTSTSFSSCCSCS